MAANKDFIQWHILERIANISGRKYDGSRLELNRVSWNGTERLDLRRWFDDDGQRKPLRGVTLTESEAARLADALLYVQGGEPAMREEWQPKDKAADYEDQR